MDNMTLDEKVDTLLDEVRAQRDEVAELKELLFSVLNKLDTLDSGTGYSYDD